MKNAPFDKSPFARCLPRLPGGLAEYIVVAMLVVLTSVIAVSFLSKAIAGMRDAAEEGVLARLEAE